MPEHLTPAEMAQQIVATDDILKHYETPGNGGSVRNLTWARADAADKIHRYGAQVARALLAAQQRIAELEEALASAGLREARICPDSGSPCLCECSTACRAAAPEAEKGANDRR